jgi:hypothetical protein
VRAFGGVLEHPERSKLWKAAGLPRPIAGIAMGDGYGHGYSLEVDQCAWGHVARKRTWLYLVGVPRELVIETIRAGGTPTHWISAFRERPGGRKHRGGSAPPGIKICSAQQRRRTPLAFAEWLVELARSVDMTARAAAS